MFWEVIKRLVDLTYLLLGLVMVVVLYSGVNQNTNNFNFEESLRGFKENITKTISNNLEYLEVKVNRVARNVDDYQNSSTTRINILEGRVTALELENKALKLQQKTINNNLNSNVVNVQK